MKVNNFVYGAFRFAPFKKLKPGATLPEIVLRSHTELRLWDDHFTSYFGEMPSHYYNHSEFYKASGDSDMDIFLCLDNNRLYVPCCHELMAFEGYRNKKGRRKKR